MILNKYLITRRGRQICSCLLNGEKTVEMHFDSPEGTRLGDIYIGKIQNIARNIRAAFVEIAPGIVGYLPLEDMKEPLYTKKGKSKGPQNGDELLVQVTREAMKTKNMALSTRITLHGKYAVLTETADGVSVSSKLSSEQREELRALLTDTLRAEASGADGEERPFSMRNRGWIVRTNAAAASAQEVKEEVRALYGQYRSILDAAMYRTCFSCLLRQPSRYLTRLDDLYSGSFDEIVTDDADLFEEIRDYLRERRPGEEALVRLYQDRMLPLPKLYSLETRLEKALARMVHLPGGGSLVIQRTEALTAVDVNTGSFEKGKQKEEAILKVNREAAEELAVQLRLRNLSGIIIVDFINMSSKENNRILMEELAALLKKDPVKCDVIDMTRLGLVEITRRKLEAPLEETVTNRDTLI